MDVNSILLAALVTCAVGAGLYAIALPLMSGNSRAEKRHAAIVASTGRRPTAARTVDSAQRRKQVTESLKDLEQRNKSKKVSLDGKLAQAGLDISRERYLVFCAVAAILGGAAVFFLSGNLFLVPAGLLVGGFGVPNWVLSFLRKRRITKFVAEFPNAMDVIVRGVKSGLPLADCVRIIATEASEPVKGEFRQIVETQSMGLSISEAIGRMVERVPVTEANFFSIVIAIQSKSGGSLAESLANLSKVLRERKKMKGKVSAMAMEAKASAAIIGALPFMVAFLVYMSNPQYLRLLWTTTAGLMVISGAGCWMLIGIFVMKNMINFDI